MNLAELSTSIPNKRHKPLQQRTGLGSTTGVFNSSWTILDTELSVFNSSWSVRCTVSDVFKSTWTIHFIGGFDVFNWNCGAIESYVWRKQSLFWSRVNLNDVVKQKPTSQMVMVVRPAGRSTWSIWSTIHRRDAINDTTNCQRCGCRGLPGNNADVQRKQKKCSKDFVRNNRLFQNIV